VDVSRGHEGVNRAGDASFGARSLALERAGDAVSCTPAESCVIETAVEFACLIEPGVSARTGAASAALTGQFRDRSLIVLSPHFDDACFSLGGFLKARGAPGVLINLFTWGSYVVRPDLARAGLPRDGVRCIRDSEDREFARACGLTRHDLECEEPVLRGRRPSDMTGLADDVGQIEQRLLARLSALADGEGTRPALFAPLGIGRHVNHRAAAEIVLSNLARLIPFFEIHFYEELPYAASPFHRLAALKRLQRRAGPLRRQVLPVNWHEKRELIGIYQSQLRAPPSLLRFRPAALPLAAHEAFWSLT